MIEFKIISCSALLLGGLILDICMLQLCFLSTYADYLCGFEQNALHHATKHRVAVALKILAPLKIRGIHSDTTVTYSSRFLGRFRARFRWAEFC